MTTTPASAYTPNESAEPTEVVEAVETVEPTAPTEVVETVETAERTAVVDPAEIAESTTQAFASPSSETDPTEVAAQPEVDTPSAHSAPARSTQPGAGTPSAQPGASVHVVDGVWTASRQPEPQAPRTLRPSTLSWGVLLVSIGLITLLIGLGVRINLATAGISVLVALGVLLLGLAMLPQRGSNRS